LTRRQTCELLISNCRPIETAMTSKCSLKFDPTTFLATIGKGRTIAEYPKDETLFAQGDSADAIKRRMPVIILCMFRFVRLLSSGHQAVAVENLALRRQLAAFKRKRKKPLLTQWDRLFWVGLSRLWSGWRDALVFVQPDTVVRWQRERFRKFWARLSQHKRGRPGRPAIAADVRNLVLRMATANPLWRAPRIHGELQMLGIAVSERTVSRILRTIRSRPPSQTWQTFLRNHLGQIVSVDFFTVPTIRLQVLYVFLVLEHRRREVLHFNITDHPTSEWVAQPRLRTLRIEEVLTAPQSPWQNAYGERLIGSIRRECLNHCIILNARHLKRTLTAYLNYYHRSRPHLALEKQCPIERQIMNHGAIVEIPELGGLHHRYERIAS
jgi:putative transposase